MLAQILAHSIDYPVEGPVFSAFARQGKGSNCLFFCHASLIPFFLKGQVKIKLLLEDTQRLKQTVPQNRNAFLPLPFFYPPHSLPTYWASSNNFLQQRELGQSCLGCRWCSWMVNKGC